MHVMTGVNGQMSFDGRSVTITRNGFLARSTFGRSNKVIPISSIAAIQLKIATSLLSGWVQLSVKGEVVKRRFGQNEAQTVSQDENAVIFNKKRNEEVEAFVAAVRAAQDRVSHGTVALSAADELSKLHALLVQGILSQFEFDAEKRRLLGL